MPSLLKLISSLKITIGILCGHRLDRGCAAIASIVQIHKFDFMRQKEKKECVCDVFDCYKKMKMLLL